RDVDRVREDAVDQHRQHGDVVEVGMGEEHVANVVQLLEGQVADSRARVEEHVVIDHHCRGTGPRADATAATQNPDAHTDPEIEKCPGEGHLAPASGMRPWGALVTPDHTPSSMLPSPLLRVRKPRTPKRSAASRRERIRAALRGSVLKINTLWDDSPETKIRRRPVGILCFKSQFFSCT